jgi:hypothetical protein
MKLPKIFVCVLLSSPLFGQQNLLPISSFYKDQFFSPIKISEDTTKFYNGNAFLPSSEGLFNLHDFIRDKSVLYYDELEYLFKKQLIELRGDGYYVTLSPTLNLGLGKDFEDTSATRLFNNTRGFVIEGDILKNFSFTTSLYENQNRFTAYETEYYSSLGERYPQADSSYLTQNAIVPGAARTKPFKVGGFDYAYAIGNVVYRPNKQLLFSAGNNAQFVGMGYRSLLLSDNSVPAIYFRMDGTFFDKFNFTLLRSKQFNLLRRPNFTTVEPYYEPKLFSSHYIDYWVLPKWRIGVFEGSYWNVGDSISTQKVRGAYYVPIPFIGSAIENDKKQVSTLAGIQTSYWFDGNLRFYGQLALSNWDVNAIGSQLGMRYYQPFGLKDAMVQVEYNNVPKRLYISDNSRLNYSAYNLPSAHPKGNGFQEYIVRFNYTKKRFYGEVKSILYLLKNHETGNLIASNPDLIQRTGQIYHQQIELGYRVNKRMNLEIFLQSRYRFSSMAGEDNTNALMFGLRTGLINHYDDF